MRPEVLWVHRNIPHHQYNHRCASKYQAFQEPIIARTCSSRARLSCSCFCFNASLAFLSSSFFSAFLRRSSASQIISWFLAFRYKRKGHLLIQKSNPTCKNAWEDSEMFSIKIEQHQYMHWSTGMWKIPKC